MSVALETLQELAAVFALPILEPNRHGVVMLRLGESDLLSVEFVEGQKEQEEQSIIMCLARPLLPHRHGVAEQALMICNANSGLGCEIRAGIVEKACLPVASRQEESPHSAHLVLMLYFTESSFRLPAVMSGIQILMDVHRQAAA